MKEVFRQSLLVTSAIMLFSCGESHASTSENVLWEESTFCSDKTPIGDYEEGKNWTCLKMTYLDDMSGYQEKLEHIVARAKENGVEPKLTRVNSMGFEVNIPVTEKGFVYEHMKVDRHRWISFKGDSSGANGIWKLSLKVNHSGPVREGVKARDYVQVLADSTKEMFDMANVSFKHVDLKGAIRGANNVEFIERNHKLSVIHTHGRVEINLEKELYSYSLGASVGNFLSSDLKRKQELGIHLDQAQLKKGWKKALSGKSELSDQVLKSSLKKLLQVEKERKQAGAIKGGTLDSSDIELYSYSLGAINGQYLANKLAQHKKLGVQLDQNTLIKGFDQSLRGESKLNDSKIKEVLVELNQEVIINQQALTKAEGVAFLASNAMKASVVTTDSGLQYEVISKGQGKKPLVTDTVEVHYRGFLTDGTEFDNSYSRGQPISFQLDRVIKGWTEGVSLMLEGSKYRFYIPSELAYGERALGKIPANSALIFEVELVKVVPSA